MPTTELKIRRDVAADIDAMTPAEGEIHYDITNKRLRVGDGSTSGGHPIVSAADHQKQTFTYVLVTGTDTLVATLAPPLASYTTGFKALIDIANNNTGAVTINFNALGAKTIKKNGGADDLVADDLVAGGLYSVAYDGVNFQVFLGSGANGRLLSVQVFESTGANTWTKPAGIATVVVEVQAGGGGGAGCASNETGAGGGGGGFTRELIDVSGTASETATVGAGGAGGAAGANNGLAGGTSSFGALCSATGGGLGAAGTGQTAGGAGGVGSSGNDNRKGQGGGGAGTGNEVYGLGGSSALGGGGRCTPNSAGDAGGAYGAGGGGGSHASASRAGGAGADGVIIVWEYS